MSYTERVEKSVVSIDGKIAEWLRVNKKTASNLAETLSINDNTLSFKRSGRSDWKLSELLLLCGMFNLSLDELTGYQS